MIPWSHFNFLSDSPGEILGIHVHDEVEKVHVFNEKPFFWFGGMPLQFIISGNTRVTVTYAVDKHNYTYLFLIIPCLMDHSVTT